MFYKGHTINVLYGIIVINDFDNRKNKMYKEGKKQYEVNERSGTPVCKKQYSGV